MTSFKFPPVYNYEPFWTIQNHENQRKKQIELWGNLVLAFMKAINKTEMDVITTLDTPLFNNKKLQRRLRKMDAEMIIDNLVATNNAKWLDDQKIRARIIWRTPEQWGTIIYKYIDGIGQNGNVLTFEELINGDEVKKQPFYKIQPDVFLEAVLDLQTKGKARVYQNPTLIESGVKFI